MHFGEGRGRGEGGGIVFWQGMLRVYRFVFASFFQSALHISLPSMICEPQRATWRSGIAFASRAEGPWSQIPVRPHVSESKERATRKRTGNQKKKENNKEEEEEENEGGGEGGRAESEL